MLTYLVRVLRPRFSLAAAFLFVTLAALALWYWYRVPFEVVRMPERGRAESETVHRTWEGTVRHGPREISIDGQPRALEHYREGIADGTWEWRSGDGRLLLAVDFHRGGLTEMRPTEDCDQRLARHLAEGTIDDPRLVQKLVSTVRLDDIEMPLQDALAWLGGLGVPISCHERLCHLPVTLEAEESPLIVVLGRMLHPHELCCDYRYGLLWVAPRDEAEHWSDPTGVSNFVPPPGSALAMAWENPIDAELIECSLRSACIGLAQKTGHQVEFDWSKLPQVMHGSCYPGANVTLMRSNHPFKHCLGLILAQAGCRVRLEGEKLLIEMQPDHPDAPYYAF